MIEYLESLDRAIVFTVNSWNTPFFDEVMWWISSRILWLPLYFFLFYLAFKEKGIKFAILFLAFVGLTIFIADTLSVYALKNTVQRYRPTHNTFLSGKLHLYQIDKTNFYAGGQYGFVSSHATNFFVIATCFALIFHQRFQKLTYFLFFCAVLVCFSRLYLGVHYLSDLIGGALLGTLISLLTYKFIWKKLRIENS